MISVAEPGGRAIETKGSSIASPMVANVSAKLMALCPSLTPLEAREIILATVEEAAWIRATAQQILEGRE